MWQTTLTLPSNKSIRKQVSNGKSLVLKSTDRSLADLNKHPKLQMWSFSKHQIKLHKWMKTDNREDLIQVSLHRNKRPSTFFDLTSNNQQNKTKHVKLIYAATFPTPESVRSHSKEEAGWKRKKRNSRWRWCCTTHRLQSGTLKQPRERESRSEWKRNQQEKR